MKRTIIILIALVLFISLPVFASTPTEENAPAATNEDAKEMIDIMTLSDNELQNVKGEGWVSIEDPNFHGGMFGGISVYEQGIVIYIFFESGLVQEYTTDGAGNLVLNGSYYPNNNNSWNNSNDVGTGFKK
jgi:hypothetical protein